MANANIFAFTDTWNDSGTTFSAIKVDVTDTASQADSTLIDLEVGGASQASITKAGEVICKGLTSSQDIDLQGNRLVMDADNDTYIEAITDDRLDLVVGGSLVARFAANVTDTFQLDGVGFSPTGAVVGQFLGFPNDANTLEPATPAGGGDLLAAANETITGNWTFTGDLDLSGLSDVAGTRDDLGIPKTVLVAADGTTDDRATIISALSSDGFAVLPDGDIAISATTNISSNQLVAGQGFITNVIAGSAVSNGSALFQSVDAEDLAFFNLRLTLDPRSDTGSPRQLRGILVRGGRQNEIKNVGVDIYGIGSYGLCAFYDYDGATISNNKVLYDDYGIFSHSSFGLSDFNSGDSRNLIVNGNSVYGRLPDGIEDAAAGGSIAAGTPTVSASEAYDTPTSGNLDGLVGLSDGEWVVLNPPASGSVTIRHQQDVSATPGAVPFSLVNGADRTFLSTERRISFKRVGDQLVHQVGGKIGISIDANSKGSSLTGNLVDRVLNYFDNGEGLGVAHAPTATYKGHHSHTHVGNVVTKTLREAFHIEDGALNVTSVGNVIYDAEFGHRIIYGGRVQIHQRIIDPSSGVDLGTDTITDTAHGLSESDEVYYNSNGNTAIGGLTSGQTYFVRNPTTNTYQLSATSGGSVIDLTSGATGSNHLFAAGEGFPRNIALIGNTYYDIGQNCISLEQGAPSGSDTECENISIIGNVMSDWGQDASSPAIRITGDGTGKVYLDGNHFRDGTGNCIQFSHFTGESSIGSAASITVGYIGTENVTGSAFISASVGSTRNILIKSGSHLSGANNGVFASGSDLTAFIGDTTYKTDLLIGGAPAMESELIRLPTNFFPLTARVVLLSDADATTQSFVKIFRRPADGGSAVEIGAAGLPLASGGLTAYETLDITTILTTAFASDPANLEWGAGDVIYVQKVGNASADGQMRFVFELNGFHYF